MDRGMGGSSTEAKSVKAASIFFCNGPLCVCVCMCVCLCTYVSESSVSSDIAG